MAFTPQGVENSELNATAHNNSFDIKRP